jgi:hypothetical protein
MDLRSRIKTLPLPPDNGAIIGAALLAFLVFLTTIQTTANGSTHPYTTDVGEIQNALPRWGTIHFPGYPLYSLTGSAFVSLTRLVGIVPAAGASLFSAVWGAVAVGLLVALDLQFDVPTPAAVVTALLFALSTSFWVDASLAEVHTMSVALLLASLLFALRFSRHGRRSDLIWLSLFASQMVLHQRAMVFAGLGLLILVLHQREALWRGLPAGLLVAALGALIYLYLPIRAWQGAEWTFSQPGSLQGFQTLLFDTKTERIITMPEEPSEWLLRVRNVANVLSLEWPLLLMAVGLGGNLIIGLRRGRLEALAILALWLPYTLLALVVREGRSSDAVLAAILPVVLMAGLGLAVLTAELLRRSRPIGTAVMILLVVAVVLLFVRSRPTVLAVTRDPGAQEPIAMAEQIGPPDGDKPITLMALWGHDFWALAYAQAYEGLLPETTLVDHNADLRAIMDDERLLTLSRTFYVRPLSWWDQHFERVYLTSYSPDIVEVALEPPLEPNSVGAGTDFMLGNGIKVRDVELAWSSPNILQLTIYWEAEGSDLADYSVAVHLVSAVPPAGPDDIVAQADSVHPVGGWYPTSRWSAGEIVGDVYRLELPDGASPEAVRLSMYQVGEDGGFVNSSWLTLPLPPR